MIDQRIKEANGRLRANNWGLSIEQIGGKLYIRGLFPPKPNAPQTKPYQQRISVAPANSKGVSIAEDKAKDIAIQLKNKEFDWADYIEVDYPKPLTIGQWVEALKVDYYQRRDKNFKTDTTWYKDYDMVFRGLNSDDLLTAEALKKAILKTRPDTRTRKRYCLALGVLARFSNLEFDPSLYSGKYSPKSRKPRQLPTDKQIVEWYFKVENPEWQWVFGMLATYGLRNHEVFFLDLEELRSGNQVITILDGKTGFRRVWPFHPEWFTDFNLSFTKVPTINLNRSNSDIGNTLCKHFRRNQKLPFKPYDLRHRWAIRTLEYGLDISLAAQQMGHSLSVHSSLYHAWIDARIHQQAFESVMKKSDRPKPPKI